MPIRPNHHAEGRDTGLEGLVLLEIDGVLQRDWVAENSHVNIGRRQDLADPSQAVAADRTEKRVFMGFQMAYRHPRSPALEWDKCTGLYHRRMNLRY